MKNHRLIHRRATAVLLAAVALPATALSAQESPIPPPPSTTTTPQIVLPIPTPSPSPPVAVAPPIVAPTPEIVPPPVVATQPAAKTSEARTRPAARTTRAEAPAAPKAAEPAPVAESVAPVAAPVPQPIVPVPAPTVAAAPAPAQPANTAPVWPLLLGVAALIVAIGVWLWTRRRSAQDDYVAYDEAVDEPVAAIPPVEETPVAAPARGEGHVVADSTAYAFGTSAVASQLRRRPDAAPPVGEPDSADVEAMAAASAPAADRPWLELMMRPIRAGTNAQDAVVEFELTVGNTGSVPAEDVRISTWLFAAGSPRESEMEGMLIDPPADARVSRATIAPGDGALVEAAITLPRSGLHDSVLPVVVADARYRLPDGSEGRTSASFAVGIAAGEEIEPFPVDSPSGLRDDILSRLHGELHRA